MTGQTGLGTWSNLGVSTLLYPGSDGKLYTFMNDRVPASEFLGKIGKHNSIDADVHANLITFGSWTTDSTFVTFDVNLRSLNAFSAPYDLFRFWKGDGGEATYDMSGLGMRSKTFGEVAFGWSRTFRSKLSVGFRVKALVGLLEADVRMRNLTVSMSGQRWEMTAEGEMAMSSPALSIQTDAQGYLDFESVQANEHNIGPAGYGGAIDLGFSYNLLPQLTLSGSVLDLGAIRWNREVCGKTPAGSYVWTGTSGSSSGSQESLEDELKEAGKEFVRLFRFKDAGSGRPAFDLLPFVVHLGAEYRVPFYDRISLGVLYTGRGGACYARHTGRISLNWNPADVLSFSTGATLNKLGQSVGFAFNLHPAGINLMLGCDYIPLRAVNIAPLFKDLPQQYRQFAIIPADRMNMNLYVGLNMALGKRRLDYARRLR